MRTGEQNAPLIDEILSLKQKQAKLLGFESYADVSLASKMAASVAEIEELHELLAAKATPAAHRELAELKEYASSKGHEGNLEHWDVPYWAERLREERFDYSDEELRPYFALPAVRARRRIRILWGSATAWWGRGVTMPRRCSTASSN